MKVKFYGVQGEYAIFSNIQNRIFKSFSLKSKKRKYFINKYASKLFDIKVLFYYTFREYTFKTLATPFFWGGGYDY